MTLYCAPRGNLSGSEAAYTLLKYAVLKYSGTDMPVVAKHPSGKPYFPDRPDLHFSLSHTSSHVMCAVSEAPVGVDIETIRSLRRGVPERVCAPEELQAFDFFELWVLKESYIKVSGNTRVSLRKICFGNKNGIVTTPETAVTAKVFHDIPGCVAAVCSKGAAIPEAIEIREV